jgi:hypothetical protein
MKLKISFATPAQRLARWEKIKQRGIWRFVFFRGVLGFGLSMGVVMFVTGRASDHPLPIALILLESLVAGFLWGLFMWFVAMRQYSRALAPK